MYQKTKAILDWMAVTSFFFVILAMPICNRLFVGYFPVQTADSVLKPLINFLIAAAFFCLLAYLAKRSGKSPLASYI